MAGQRLSIEEALIKHGYRYAGNCNCDGFNTAKYNAGDYQLKWRKNRYVFRMYLKRSPVIEWTSVSEVENYLNKLHEPAQTI